MRVRTASRREEIIKVATEVFRELGYTKASMTVISSRIGGSKGTLYGYFKSKDEIFSIVMIESLREEFVISLTELLNTDDTNILKILNTFGYAYLALITSENALSMVRTAISEGANTKLGRLLYNSGPKAGWEPMVVYLTDLRRRGILNLTDPVVAARHLKGLLEAGIVEPLLFGAQAEFERRKAVAAAVDVFLRAYASVDRLGELPVNVGA